MSYVNGSHKRKSVFCFGLRQFDFYFIITLCASDYDSYSDSVVRKNQPLANRITAAFIADRVCRFTNPSWNRPWQEVWGPVDVSVYRYQFRHFSDYNMQHHRKVLLEFTLRLKRYNHFVQFIVRYKHHHRKVLFLYLLLAFHSDIL